MERYERLFTTLAVDARNQWVADERERFAILFYLTHPDRPVRRPA